MPAHIVVIGLGVTGDAVARHGRAAGDRVTIVEESPRSDDTYRSRVERVTATGAEVVDRPDSGGLATLVAGADLLVPSPGVPEHHAAIAVARAAGIPVRAEIDLAAERMTSPFVAITGTNGKSTVTTLVEAMLTASGVDAVAAGNIGLPLIDAATSGHEVVVAEVSSFQLAFTTAAFRPAVAVLLNLAADHLDWHGSFDAYAQAKAHVFEHQRGEDLLVFNADDTEVARVAADAPARSVPFSIGDGAPNGFRIHRDSLVDPAGAAIAPATGSWASAPRDRANALAAAAAALAVAASPTGVRTALARFEGLPHRLQLVGEGAGVRYYDDSKATNPHATVAAVEGAAGPVVLVAGGRNKGLDLTLLRSLAPRLRGVVTIGEAAAEIEAALAGAVSLTRAADMRAAVARATDLAQPGDVVLLSPACASFDWYESYGARGDDFTREVERLLGRANAPLEGQVSE
jgi:UDP-N-acetylmuramoylalanine--D-glutamate ligase